MEQKRIGIIGSGSWATAIAKIVTDNGHPITWWVRQQANIDYFVKRKHNQHYLRNAYFNVQQLSFSTDIQWVVAQADILIIAVPSIHIESTLAGLDAADLKGKIIISAVKGVLPKHNILLNQYLAEKFNIPCHAEYKSAIYSAAWCVDINAILLQKRNDFIGQYNGSGYIAEVSLYRLFKVGGYSL